MKVLKSSGIFDAYQSLQSSLCEYGLPSENLFEFSALMILMHEKKLKAKKKTELKERIMARNAQKVSVSRAALEATAQAAAATSMARAKS